MKTNNNLDLVAVATIHGKREMVCFEYNRYLDGAKRVWIVDPEDPQCTKPFACCRIVGDWPQPRKVIEAARKRFKKEVMAL